jgi:hypothetical protein
MSENLGGRPPIYEDTPEAVEEMQRRADKYFEDCDGKPLLDPDGQPMIDKYGNQILVGVKPYTITGLALALGFNSRSTFLDYQEKSRFSDTITRAKAKVEQYAEERLFDKDGANGAKFSLANNFKRWKEKQEIEGSLKNTVTINVELVDDDE